MSASLTTDGASAEPCVIRRVTAEEMGAYLEPLSDLLREVVDDGASVGFLPPLGAVEALDYWRSVAAALRTPWRILLVAEIDGSLAGTVQLDLATKANARHRAEVMKLLVALGRRRRGIGQRLMAALEAEARQLGRTTLVLDTREGDESERLYRRIGYTRAGIIPEYCRSEDGALDATVIYYKLLRAT